VDLPKVKKERPHREAPLNLLGVDPYFTLGKNSRWNLEEKNGEKRRFLNIMRHYPPKYRLMSVNSAYSAIRKIQTIAMTMMSCRNCKELL